MKGHDSVHSGTVSTSTIHLARAWVVRPFVRFLEDLGCPVERYLLASHISPDALEDDQAPIPIRLATHFGERVSRAEGIDHLGLRVGQSLQPEDLGNLRVLMRLSRNLHEYLQGARRFARSVSTDTDYLLRVEGDSVRFEHRIVGSHPRTYGHEFTLAATINTLRSLAGPTWRPTDIVLPCGTVEGLAEIHDAFENARVDPSAHGASFAFPLSFLTLPAPRLTAGPDLSPDSGLGSLDTGGFRHMARRLVECLVLDGLADVHTAAEASGMSVRTFQRRLTECGLVFSDLAREARVSLAERWLLEDGRSVQDVARSLGYTDPSNFTRAFRRLNGVPPRAFRAASAGRARRPRT